MEARQTFKGTSVSKGLVVVMAIAATAGIAAIGALATKDLGGSHASVNGTVQAPAALPLRQDNDYPVISRPALTDRGAERGFVQTHNGRMGGTIDSAGVGATADGNGPDSDLTRALPVSGPVAIPLWLQNEMGTSQQSSDKIVIDQTYVNQYLTSSPGWDARSVREGHGP
jgi:hypothetical protein